MHKYDLLKLRTQCREINNISYWCDCIAQLNVGKLIDAYKELHDRAPHRHDRKKKYFVSGHTGVPTSETDQSPQREKHLAMALWNCFATMGAIKGPAITNLRLLDYELPLKAEGSDAGVGKVDLFAVMNKADPCVIELKIDSKGKTVGTPLYAFLEAFAYCAIVEANINDISADAKECGQTVAAKLPQLMILAPDSYWKQWNQKTPGWQPALTKLADDITAGLGLQSHFVALHDANFSMGAKNKKPVLTSKCFMQPL